MARDINQAGIDLIKQFEGFRADPYQDSVGVWTQGFGHTQGVDEDSDTVDEETAENWLEDDLEEAEHAVELGIHVNLNDNQFAALVSLVFNIGQAPLKGTLGTKLNSGDYEGASLEFPKWCHAGGTVIQGLLNRRNAEMDLFNTPPSA